ncbi:MAG: thioredoxin domain-containing protein [Pirellulales bacterium]
MKLTVRRWGIVVPLLALMLANAHGEEPNRPARPAKGRNRLAKETSPYLLLHAGNPVDWYPWGEEALARARREQKPIFLSIGYSSCHWCHVMERESFLDEEIAEVLNKHFICIKVDREERPDVDAVYMTALHVFNRLTGNGRGGGWPLSMFLTSEAEPFFGGTYFPARDGDRGTRMGFLTLLRRIHELWEQNGDKLRQDGRTLTRYVKQEMEQPRPTVTPFTLNASLLDDVQAALVEQYDAQHGGFGFQDEAPDRPKFPEPSKLFFLAHQSRRARAEGRDATPTLNLLVTTLDHMARGGIRDHLGGGFHRYSVDRFWQIPHFEKMLYDNAQLLTAYAEGYELTERPDFRRVAAEIFDFAQRELRAPEGGYYAALDAESEGEEGRYYAWSQEEVQRLLTAEQWQLCGEIYGLTGPANFEQRWYVPQLAAPLTELATARKLTFTQLDDRLRPCRAALLAARQQRPRPLTDTKILTSWNGLMIRGLADAGRIFRDPQPIAAATSTAEFILTRLRLADGRLARTFSAGEARLAAYLDDYAFLIEGLLALHRATDQPRWLEEADRLQQEQIRLFADDQGGGFFFTSRDHESLLARAKEITDGAEPAGNSVAAGNLLYLARTRQQPAYRDRARATITAAAPLWSVAPASMPRLALAVAELTE